MLDHLYVTPHGFHKGAPLGATQVVPLYLCRMEQQLEFECFVIRVEFLRGQNVASF